jgi:hypothetical protein
MTELEKLKQKSGKRGQQQGGAKGKQKRQKPEGGKTEKPDKTGKCDHYCFAHGFQNSHTSEQCKVMSNQPANFTADQRKATSPHSPVGGSTAVRGREPQSAVQ